MELLPDHVASEAEPPTEVARITARHVLSVVREQGGEAGVEAATEEEHLALRSSLLAQRSNRGRGGRWAGKLLLPMVLPSISGSRAASSDAGARAATGARPFCPRFGAHREKAERRAMGCRGRRRRCGSERTECREHAEIGTFRRLAGR